MDSLAMAGCGSILVMNFAQSQRQLRPINRQFEDGELEIPANPGRIAVFQRLTFPRLRGLVLAVLAVPLMGDDHGHRFVGAGPDRGEADAAADTL